MHCTAMPEFTNKDIERFWHNIAVGKPYECWPWKYTQFTGGYGAIKVNRKNLRSHRVAYYLHYNVDPLSQLVCHRCDNPACCNPFHLFIGTERENTQDCLSKGRHFCGRGERHGSRTHPERWARGERVAGSKLTLDQVRQIRSLYAAGGITQESLGQQFGVTRRAIGAIIKGQNWKHAIGSQENKSLSDPKRRGRAGTYSHRAKLSENQVREVRQLYAQCNTTYSELAQKFNVSPGAIRFIVKRQTWTHID